MKTIHIPITKGMVMGVSLSSYNSFDMELRGW